MLENTQGAEIFKTNAQKYEARINVIDSELAINEEDIADLSIETVCSDKMIGSIASKFVKFTLFNASLYNLTEESIDIEIIMLDEDLEKNAVYSLGTYKIVESTKKDIAKDEVVIKARDLTYTFTKKYKIDLEYPKTIQEIINIISDDNGIEIKYQGIKNLNYSVTKEFYYKDYILSSLLKEIGEATASNVFVNNQNCLVFKPFKSESVLTLTDSDIFELSISDIKSKNYNTVVASRIENDEKNTTDDVFYPEELEENREEYKIIANNLIDNDRVSALPEILDGIANNSYKGATLEIKGAPFLEPFDKLQIEGKESGFIYINDSTFDSSQGITTLESQIKTKTETDYKAATKDEKILKTEIKVDKAIGKITSVVNDLKEEKERLSEIEQNVENITIKVQTIGGSNLIKDSVLFGYRGELKNGWNNKPEIEEIKAAEENSEELETPATEEDTQGSISTLSIYDPESISSYGFKLNNKSIYYGVTDLDINNPYSFSIRVYKDEVGSGYIKIYEKSEDTKKLIREFNLEANKKYEYQKILIENIKIKTPNIIIEYHADEDAEITFTDNIFNIGSSSILWTVALGEIMGVNTQFNNNGMFMKQEGEGYQQSIEITPKGMIGKYNEKSIFELSEDKTISAKFIAKNQIEMGNIKIIPVTKGSNQGWAFVDIGGN